MRTLLIGNPGATWRPWLKEFRGKQDLVCLDPADSSHPRPAQLTLFRGERPSEWRFYGSVDGFRLPHLLVAAATKLVCLAETDVVIQAPAYRPGPVARHTLVVLAEALRPDRIVIANSCDIADDGFYVGPDRVDLEAGFPVMVESAQRKAKWLGFLDSATGQELFLDRISIEGARLGSGRALGRSDLERALPGAVHAEVCGSTLFVIADQPLEDSDAARALDTYHASRLQIASPSDYRDLVCALARGSGDDFGFGIIENIDFQRRVVTFASDAIPPAPATILRLGSLRVDSKGNERGDVKPWTV